MSEYSVSMLKLKDNLIVSPQTTLHDRLALQFRQDILQKLLETKSKNIIIDVSAIDVVDSFLGRVIMETAISAKIIGTNAIISGLRPDVALSLVEMGFKMREDISLAIDLEAALRMTKRKSDKDARTDTDRDNRS